MDESDLDSDFHIPGYVLKPRRDRLTDGGGGVCFYVSETINFIPRPDLRMRELENECIEIHHPHSKPIIVVNWYRPPKAPVSIFSQLESLLSRLDVTNNEYYLLGDMNADMLSTKYDNDVRLLNNTTDIYGLQQLINEPTRITEKSSTLLDLIYTNCPDKVLCSGVAHISISDHSLVFVCRKLSIRFPCSGHKLITYRCFKNFDKAKFREDINKFAIDLSNLNSIDDPNTGNFGKHNFFLLLIITLQYVHNVFAPVLVLHGLLQV